MINFIAQLSRYRSRIYNSLIEAGGLIAVMASFLAVLAYFNIVPVESSLSIQNVDASDTNKIEIVVRNNGKVSAYVSSIQLVAERTAVESYTICEPATPDVEPICRVSYDSVLTPDVYVVRFGVDSDTGVIEIRPSLVATNGNFHQLINVARTFQDSYLYEKELSYLGSSTSEGSIPLDVHKDQLNRILMTLEGIGETRKKGTGTILDLSREVPSGLLDSIRVDFLPEYDKFVGRAYTYSMQAIISYDVNRTVLSSPFAVTLRF